MGAQILQIMAELLTFVRYEDAGSVIVFFFRTFMRSHNVNKKSANAPEAKFVHCIVML